MASLASTIKANGNLAKVSAEELAQQAGRSAAPINPMETKVLGANPDQAKMAGVPAQKMGALRTSIQDAGKDLTTNQNTEQVRTKATKSEQTEMQRAESVGKFSELGDRVETMAQDALKNARANIQYLPDTPPDVVVLLNKIKADPTDTQAVMDLNAKLGRTQENLATGDELLSLFAPEDQVLAEQAGLTFQNLLDTGKVDFTSLGFRDAAQVASLLGVKHSELVRMNIPKLLETIQGKLTTEYDNVENLTNRANDPLLGPAERAQARKELRTAGAVGIRSAESGIDKLAEDLVDATKIQINGEETAVEDILKDNVMSGLITEYITNPEKAEEIKKTQPALAEYIDSNREMFEAATANIDEATLSFNSIQTTNNDKAVIKGKNGKSLGTISDEVMSAIIPTWGEPVAEEYDLNAYPVFQTLNSPNISDEQRIGLQKNLESLPQNMIADFSKLSFDDLKKIGALNPTSPEWQEFQNKITQNEVISQINTSDKDSVARAMGMNSMEDVLALQREVRTALNYGAIKQSDIDAFIPNFTELNYIGLANWMRANKVSSIQDALNSKGSIKNLISKMDEAKAKMPDLPGDLENFFASKKTLDSVDFNAATKNLSVSELLAIDEDKTLFKKITDGAKTELNKKISEKVTADIDDMITDTFPEVKGEKTLAKTIAAIQKGMINEEKMTELLLNLEDTMRFPYAKDSEAAPLFKTLKDAIEASMINKATIRADNKIKANKKPEEEYAPGQFIFNRARLDDTTYEVGTKAERKKKKEKAADKTYVDDTDRFITR